MIFKSKKEMLSNLSKYFYFLLTVFISDTKKYKFNDNETDKLIDFFIMHALNDLQGREVKKECINEENFIYLKNIIKNLMIEENKTIGDFLFIGNSAKSNAYKIGTKVLKLSYPKEDDNIPKSKYNIEFFYDQVIIDGLTVRFDIMDYTESLVHIDISEQEKEDIVFEIYKGYRKEGKIWADPKIENIGRLLRENKINLSSVIYIKEKENILKPGDFVNYDVEYIYEEKDFDYRYLFDLIYLDCYDKMEKKISKRINTKKLIMV